MAEIQARLIAKQNGQPGVVPQPTDLEAGELAVGTRRLALHGPVLNHCEQGRRWKWGRRRCWVSPRRPMGGWWPRGAWTCACVCMCVLYLKHVWLIFWPKLLPLCGPNLSNEILKNKQFSELEYFVYELDKVTTCRRYSRVWYTLWCKFYSK